MDLLDGLVHEQAEEDHRRARRREVVLAEELVLARAGLVDLEVAGEAVGLLDRHALAQLEALGGEQILLHVGPLREPLPDGREVVLGRLVRGEDQHLLRPGEGDVVQAHPVEEGDAVLGLEGRAVVEGPEVAVDLLGARKLRGERADHDHRELQALGLVDGHHLHVALGEGLVGVLVLVDAAVVQQAQEAVEEVEPQELAVAVRDDGVVVVALEDVQELREDREVAGRVLVLRTALLNGSSASRW